MRVDLVDVLLELAAWLGLYLLDFLEATGLNEGSLGLGVLWEHLGELTGDVGQDVVWGKLEEWFESWQVSAHLDDVLQGLLGLILEILGAFWEHVDGQKSGWDVGFSQELGVVWGVSTDLTEGPGGSSLEVILWLVEESILEWSNTLGDDNGHSKGVIESRDVSESHDTWKSGVTLGLTDVVDSGSSTTRVHDQLGKLGGLLSDLSDAGSGVLSDLHIHVLEAVEDSWEDLSLNDYFSKINGVLGDLSKALADVSLQLSIWVRDQSSKVWNGSLINDSLGKFFSVLGNLTESSC